MNLLPRMAIGSIQPDTDLQPMLWALNECRNQQGIKSGRGFYDWSDRDAAELIERRDAQIVRQLNYLKETGAL